jgi:hypothetical protein
MNYKIFTIFVLLLSSVLITACSKPQDDGKFDGFATCLTEKNAIMYGTEWCSHCQNQKKMFGSSFEYVNFVDCDANPTACDVAGVTGYPTWQINGELYPGVQSFYDLAKLTGCTLE